MRGRVGDVQVNPRLSPWEEGYGLLDVLFVQHGRTLPVPSFSCTGNGVASSQPYNILPTILLSPTPSHNARRAPPPRSPRDLFLTLLDLGV